MNEREGEVLLDRLKYYCREFLGEIERTGIEICRQWVRNNIAPVDIMIGDKETTKYSHDYEAMRSILQEGVKRAELMPDTPVDDLALFINAELYGLMIAWCMSDASVIGSAKTDLFCETVIEPALKPYRQ